MCNSIFIDKKTLPKAKDGDEFEMTIKGIYRTDEDGERKLDVMEVDGNPVVDPEETESACSMAHDDLINNEPLQLFILKTRKK